MQVPFTQRFAGSIRGYIPAGSSVVPVVSAPGSPTLAVLSIFRFCWYTWKDIIAVLCYCVLFMIQKSKTCESYHRSEGKPRNTGGQRPSQPLFLHPPVKHHTIYGLASKECQHSRNFILFFNFVTKMSKIFRCSYAAERMVSAVQRSVRAASSGGAAAHRFHAGELDQSPTTSSSTFPPSLFPASSSSSSPFATVGGGPVIEGIPLTEYATRRRILMGMLPPNSVAVIPAAPTV